MSKIIKPTEHDISAAIAEFSEAVRSGKFSEGKITFTKVMGFVDRKATVYFTELAWLKMQTLVDKMDKEVGWHGIATRGDDPTKDEYFITDILVYPQEVTGATVTTDQNEYQTWLMSHEDTVFDNIRMQGHSHVNMGVTPSSVDNTLYESILSQLNDTMFYIFMIVNKRGERTVKIYDMAKNIMFDTSDVTLMILNDGTGIEHWFKTSKELIKDKTPVTTSYSPTVYGGSSYYGGNYSSWKNDKSEDKKDKKDKKKKEASKFYDDDDDDYPYGKGGSLYGGYWSGRGCN